MANIINNIIDRLFEKWFNVQKKTSDGVQSAKDAMFRGGLIVIVAILIVWISIFLYTAFYYAYMPSMTYVRPVHLQFRACDQEKGLKGMCSFPSAYVHITNKQQIFMVGQPYKVNLLLEMPESPANKDLGMFMVCAQMRSRNAYMVAHSCRSAMLHYRSDLLHTLKTLTYSPMMIFGSAEEKQNVVLELFGNFEEDQSHPATVLHIEIQSRQIEFYSASVVIRAHLSGLRYLMFHWPILSAFIGISTNLFFIVLVCILSYLHFSTDDENMEETFNYLKAEIEDEKDSKFTGDTGADTSSTEDVSLLDDVSKLKVEKIPSTMEPMEPILSKTSYVEEISNLIEE